LELVTLHPAIVPYGKGLWTGVNSRFDYPNGISLWEGQGDTIFDINMDALGGIPGIFTHTSYRTDKSDCHPQKELVDMLCNLSSL
jgi:hypothetical protein